MSFPGTVSGSPRPIGNEAPGGVNPPIAPPSGEGGVGGVGGIGSPVPPTPPPPPPPPPTPGGPVLPRPLVYPSSQVSVLISGKLAEALNLSGKDVESILTYIQELKMKNIDAMTEGGVGEMNIWQKMTDIQNKAAQDIKKKGIEQMQKARDLDPAQMAMSIVGIAGSTVGLVVSIIAAILTCGAASGAVAAAATAEAAAVAGTATATAATAATAAASTAVGWAAVSVTGTCLAGVATVGSLAMTGLQMSGGMEALCRHMDPKAASNMLMAINIVLAVVGIGGGIMSGGGAFGVSKAAASVTEIVGKGAAKSVEMVAMGASRTAATAGTGAGTGATAGTGAVSKATTAVEFSVDFTKGVGQGGMVVSSAGKSFLSLLSGVGKVALRIGFPVSQALLGIASSGVDYMATSYQAEAQKYDAEADLARAPIAAINQKAIDELVGFLQSSAKNMTSAISVCSQMLRDVAQRQETVARNTAI